MSSSGLRMVKMRSGFNLNLFLIEYSLQLKEVTHSVGGIGVD